MQPISARVALFLFSLLILTNLASAAGGSPAKEPEFPPRLDSCHDQDRDGILAILANRIRQQSFNRVASLIILAAAVHTFLSILVPTTSPTQ